MKNYPQPPDFSVSQKLYRCLLRAYPKAHRAEYGAAMAQLFRDHCRDSWNESRNWGLLKLWLRILPDLARTSILERLAALNERKTMTDKLANLFSSRSVPATAFWRAFVLVFLLIFLASVVMTYLSPEAYASTARIKVEKDNTVTPGVTAGNDPNFLQKTFEIIQSQVVLDPVIEQLKLNEKWGKKYNNGVALKTAITLQILQPRLALQPVRNTELINVTVYSEDRNEAAQIANAIAQSYQDYRIESQAGKLGAQIPKFSTVEIVDTAKPGLAPVRPNKPLNIAFGAGLGILLALIVGGISALAAFLIRKRTCKIPATT